MLKNKEIHVYAPYEELSTFGINISSHTEYYLNMDHKSLPRGNRNKNLKILFSGTTKPIFNQTCTNTFLGEGNANLSLDLHIYFEKSFVREIFIIFNTIF